MFELLITAFPEMQSTAWRHIDENKYCFVFIWTAHIVEVFSSFFDNDIESESSWLVQFVDKQKMCHSYSRA